MKYKLTVLCMIALSAFAVATCGGQEETKLCGNGKLDFSESCDGSNLGGWTCGDIPALGEYGGGVLSCSNQCILDTSTCDPCWGYPCEPTEGYGRVIGDIIEDNTFIVANDAAKDYTTGSNSPEEFKLSHIYKKGIAHDGQWKGILIFVTTGWCPYCRVESDLLEESYQYYKDRGILFLAVVAQDSYGATADAEYANGHAFKYDWTFPTVAGEFPTKYWPQQVGYPLNMLIDVDSMEIVKADAGAFMQKSDVDAYLVNFVEQAE